MSRRRDDAHERPFDPGLQPERVALSWRRTALAVAVGSLVYARLIAPVIGAWALVPTLAGLVLATVMGLKSTRRYRHHHRTLTSQRGHLADGALMAFIAASVSAAGLFAFILAIVGRAP
ncbi:DUF202 domain-containing protein [Tessaracoccus sp. OS52]|uniref:DUF202 domain-containing protein n=1 Tax=Tessaracoccus sp. OS52 TaxID=2886691 RepID=UPI001D118AB9|nr:DUF202 domain-containing protein [Tessaracoccus sp. OS52]MCC2594665.1 DUF202 domain-containing protein [Tessaracoccus sp. OS52]